MHDSRKARFVAKAVSTDRWAPLRACASVQAGNDSKRHGPVCVLFRTDSGVLDVVL